jgi:nitrite reductase (NO-forming)
MKAKKSTLKPSAGPDLHKAQRSRFDDAEPSTANVPMPVWVFVALAILVFGGMYFLDEHGGGFNSVVYTPFASSNEVAVYNRGSDDAIARGVIVYAQTCQLCHQPSGMGTPGQFPPLAGSEWVLAKEPDRAIRIVLDGLTGPVTVKGEPWNATMVPWRGTLSDRQIADVLSYVRNSFGNKAAPVNPAKVKAIRDETAARGGAPWTGPDLEKVPVQ